MLTEMLIVPVGDVYGDTYEDFNKVYSEMSQQLIVVTARQLLEAGGYQTDEVAVSGYGPTDLDTTGVDQTKLQKRSSIPKTGYDIDDERPTDFGGDDSNSHNITQRAIQEVRDQIGRIGREMSELDAAGELTKTIKAASLARINDLRQLIEAHKSTASLTPSLPVYYATPFDGLSFRNTKAEPIVTEHNPLAYIGETSGLGHLAFYDLGGLLDAGVNITPKHGDERQLRIATTGALLLEHTVARLDLVLTPDTTVS